MLIFAFLLFPIALPDPLDVDLHRFPPLEVCQSAVTLNRAYLEV